MFLNDIASLSAKGGGDYEELAFKGMDAVFDYYPERGSPLFVFTDASPKDGNNDNITKLIELAAIDETKIFFFLNQFPCGSKNGREIYKGVAEKTGGNIIGKMSCRDVATVSQRYEKKSSLVENE